MGTEPVKKASPASSFAGPTSGPLTITPKTTSGSDPVDEVALDDAPHVIGNYHICVVKNKRLDLDTIVQAKQLKLIMQFGVGLEGVEIDAATKDGIKVTRIPGDLTGNAASCAEMAIYLMMGLLRK